MLKIDLSFEGNELEKQFNLKVDDSVPMVWAKTQDKVNAVIRKQVEAVEGEEDPDFDATEALAIFFGAFNTQELQDAALLQFVIRDIQERTSHIAHSPAKDEAMELLLKGLADKLGEDEPQSQDAGEDIL